MAPIENVYGTSDIITLQEASGSFLDQARERVLGRTHWIVSSKEMDAVGDQNSVVFLRRETFPAGPTAEITALVEGSFEEGTAVPIARGGILAITAVRCDVLPRRYQRPGHKTGPECCCECHGLGRRPNDPQGKHSFLVSNDRCMPSSHAPSQPRTYASIALGRPQLRHAPGQVEIESFLC